MLGTCRHSAGAVLRGMRNAEGMPRGALCPCPHALTRTKRECFVTLTEGRPFPGLSSSGLLSYTGQCAALSYIGARVAN
eukprot:1161810-Pelagomonas_calceolata.AAC.7